MPVTVIVGGQFGSEGKGKVAQFVAQERGASIAIRVGGPNSGHTGTDLLCSPVVLRQLPTSALVADVTCVLGAGSLVDPQLLLREAEETNIGPERLYIDENATILIQEDISRERESGLRTAIGSTLSGTGAALQRRIARDPGVRRAGQDDDLRQFVRSAHDIRRMLGDRLNAGERALVEGTQGFGLSLLHSPHYPFVTSRDTTAATFVGEAGLSPLDVDEVFLVLRAFPIRVSGNSGPLPMEIDWDTVSRESGSLDPIIEYTSVTRSVRRVGRFDHSIVREAIAANRPTHVVLNHLDYLDVRARKQGQLTDVVGSFVAHVETRIGRRVDFCGLGPSVLVTNDQHSSHLASGNFLSGIARD